MNDPLERYMQANNGDDEKAVEQWLDDVLGGSAPSFRVDHARELAEDRSVLIELSTRRPHSLGNTGIGGGDLLG